GMINYSSGGNGTGAHLTGALFMHVAGIHLVHVPYKSVGAGISAVLSREVHVTCVGMALAAPQIAAGRVKAYAVASKQRFPTAPDVPTTAEAGLPAFEATTWFGMFGPAHTPSTIVARLNRDIGDILRAPATRAAMLAQGAEPVPGTPEEFGAFVKSEIVKWKEVARVSGATMD
ncbi:MAG: transporter substrate-binding protein, partial [Betaproteobacteria bacterium]|nr:transporter substrate-binding protein [Betaproteobacteria bacterium]